MKCNRCNRETHLLEECNYCHRLVCRSCEKSAKRTIKTVHLMICKDCWTDMKKRRQFKSA